VTETQTPVEEQVSSTLQPGDLSKQLIACRERAGFDIEQAAVEMHLSLNILRALEKEDFAHLPEPPYIRGYLRGYAKLADRDAKDLIRTYEVLRGASPDDVAHHFAPTRSLHNKTAQPSLSPTTIKFIGFGSVVLLVGLISMIPGVRNWANNTWTDFSAQTNPPEMPRPPSAMDTFAARKAAEEKAAADALAKVTAEQQAAAATVQANAATSVTTTATQATPPTTEANATATTQDTAVTPPSSEPAKVADATVTTDAPATPVATAPTTPSEPIATSTQDTAKPVDNTTVVTAPVTPVNSTPPAPVPTETPAATPATGTTTPATAANTPATTAPATTDPAAAGTQPTPLAPIVGEATIKMEFSDEVWVQVKGADKKTVFESLNTNGTTKEFKAKPPLNFKIGNAPGAKIYINGQLYDQSPYTKGSVARFKIE
jgi:cytoskeletal protein RodZ